MKSKMKTYIVIAAYNEEKKIASVIKDLNKHGYKNVIVVDDGSKDSTFNIAEKAGAIALKHIINRGQGASLQTGIEYALQLGADYIVTFDADGQHHAQDIKKMIEAVQHTNAEAALGSRFLTKDSNTPPIRKMVLKAGVIFQRILYGVKLTDAHNGFRLLTRSAAEKIKITSDRMEHASQIVEEIHNKRIRYVEVPVKITYTDYSKEKGQSSLNSIKLGFKMILRKLID